MNTGFLPIATGKYIFSHPFGASFQIINIYIRGVANQQHLSLINFNLHTYLYPTVITGNTVNLLNNHTYTLNTGACVVSHNMGIFLIQLGTSPIFQIQREDAYAYTIRNTLPQNVLDTAEIDVEYL